MESLQIKDIREGLIESHCHGLNFAPEYTSRGLSNHFPMALYALCQLGTTPERIQEFCKYHLAHLEKPSPLSNVKINQSNFCEHLGQRKAYLGYFYYFRDKISGDNPLPEMGKLISGIAAGAFHALIRLAYGLESSLKSEVAAGLAYLADAYQETVQIDECQINTGVFSYSDFYTMQVKMHMADKITIPKLQGVIFEKMRRVASDRDIKKILCQACYSKDLTLPEIASCNLDLYLRTNNFTALHMVTAAHAARVIAPYITEIEKFLSVFAANSLTAMLTISAKEINEPITVNSIYEIDEIVNKISDQYDEHDLKMAYTCIEEYNFYKKPDYLAAALFRLKDNKKI